MTPDNPYPCTVGDGVIGADASPGPIGADATPPVIGADATRAFWDRINKADALEDEV